MRQNSFDHRLWQCTSFVLLNFFVIGSLVVVKSLFFLWDMSLIGLFVYSAFWFLAIARYRVVITCNEIYEVVAVKTVIDGVIHYLA